MSNKNLPGLASGPFTGGTASGPITGGTERQEPAWHLSPTLMSDELKTPLSFDQKVNLFEDRVRGWQIDIADQVQDTIEHSGFAVLSILFSYFEMIAAYLTGDNRRKPPSPGLFKEGATRVFDSMLPPGAEDRRSALDRLYQDVRYGLYHQGLTRQRVSLQKGLDQPLVVTNEGIALDPHALVALVRSHFTNYVARLRDQTDTGAREAFEARFDVDNG